MTPFLAILAVFAPGIPLGYALTRNALTATVAAPLITGVTAALGTILMLATGGPLLAWSAGLFLAQWAVAGVLLVRRTVAPLPGGTWAEARWLFLPLTPMFLEVLAPPILWDSHSIWWLHAGYFSWGGDFARAAMGNPAVTAFSHTDYPPLTSATTSVVWGVLPGANVWDAQFASAALSFSAIACLVYAVRRITEQAPVVVSRTAAVGVGLAAWSTAPYTVVGGMADALWATSVVGAALLLLFGRKPFAQPALPLLMLAAAALSKNEGYVAAGIVALVVTVRERRNLRRAWVVWLPFAAGQVWSTIAHHVGAVGDVHFRVDTLRGHDAVHRFGTTLAAMWHEAGLYAVLGLAVAVLGGLLLRRRRERLGLGSDVWLWLVVAAYVSSLMVTYVVTPIDLNWWIITSMDRVMLLVVLAACASAAVWAAAACSPLPLEEPAVPEQRAVPPEGALSPELAGSEAP
ncbi:hypothetical protein Lfu02_11040 [Longispora fulva]|uniref:LPXTG-motif cell wall-anchored protein n=1 Tax=Longispora fulva TaxID=619741 RepID=A0A8J7G7C2_9ACTN|nr:LPXTG cell wall anchor domain-containing protein [Longispora fulva]MBG6135033.1 LPXTG-motif cell wall-anchored protein [Longispora fulva]GIG56732.1 hypothetical protein Lfu02_11040 [Longispora fulva]